MASFSSAWQASIAGFGHWFSLWLALTLPLALVDLLSGDYQQAILILAQLALALATYILLGTLLARLGQRAIRQLLFAYLLVTALLAGSGWLFGAYSFHGIDRFWKSLSNGTLQQTVYERGFKRWQVHDAPATWTLEGRLANDTLSQDWRRNNRAAIKLLRLADASGTFTRISAGTDPRELQISKRYLLDQAISGRTFKVSLELRGQVPPSDAYIMTTGGGRFPLLLSPDWQRAEYTWTAGGNDTQALRLILRQLNGLEFDVRNVEMFELVAGSWQSLGSGLGEGVRLRAEYEGEPPVYQDYPLVPDWQSYQLDLPDFMPGRALVTTLDLPENARLAVRDLQFETASGVPLNLRLIRRDVRQRLWFPDQNLAGHSIAIAGLSFLAITSSLLFASAGFVIMIGAVLLTGSRAALLVALLAGLLLLGWYYYRQQRFRLFLTIWLAGSLVVLIALIATPATLRALTGEQLVSRPAIWQIAWQALLEHPLLGIPNNDFAPIFASRYGGATLVTHAHNFWLELATDYGILGLVMSLVFSAGLALFAWRRTRAEGLFLVLACFGLQLFDTTLLFSGVLLSLMVGLLSLAQNKTVST